MGAADHLSGVRYPLNVGASVTLTTVAGVVRGTVTLAPPGTERWHLTRAAVVTNQATTVTTMPVASLYLDSISDQNLIDSTYTGARDATDLDLMLEKGQRILCEWVAGVAASVATLSLFGTRILY